MRLIGQAKTKFLLAAILIAGCGCSRSGESLDRKATGFVAIVGVGEDDPLWPVLRETATRLHGELGLATIPLRIAAPPTQSVNAQRKLIRQLADEGMAGLCVQVSDPAGLLGTLDAVAARGVPVVTMLRPVEGTTSFVHTGSDDAAVGAALADALHAALGGHGTAVVLHADSVDKSSARKHAAFSERLKSYGQLAILFDRDCEGDTDRSRQIIDKLMRRYPKLGAWVVIGNWPLRRHPDGPLSLPQTCRMIAVDPFPHTWSAIEGGLATTMIATEYDRIAEHALTTCLTMTLGKAQIPTSFSAEATAVGLGDLEAFKRKWQRWTTPEDAAAK